MNKRFFIFCSGFLLVSGLFGQEILSGLQFNEKVKQGAENNADGKSVCNCSNVNEEALQLPFLDDFSTSSVFADPTKWVNSRSVFINKDFPYFPPNLSAATFDAIDKQGKIYQNASWVPFEADVLTSRPIRLDSIFAPVARALGPSDSVYLSFFYQPQGTGDEPEPWDTLLLEFARKGDTIFQYMDSVEVTAQYYLTGPGDTLKSGTTLAPPLDQGCDTAIRWINYGIFTWNDTLMIPCDSVFGPEITWDKKWYAEGMKLDTFYKYNNRYFVQVMVPLYDSLPDTVYFHDEFQFRFRNYASIANDIVPSWRSNVDQWNVDYIYLNYNRTKDDTTYRALGFTQRAPSFLQNYQAMPYRQYRSDPINTLKESFDMEISNLDEIEHNSNYRYTVEQVDGDFNYAFDGGNFNVPEGFYTNTEFVQQKFSVDFSRDSASYIIRHYISDSSDANILVDSATYHQGFYNYYAYDDGTPEFGYGIEPAGALMAYQFKLTTPDTLRGVQMYFNKVKDEGNVNFFNLLVWKDNNGQPGEVVYEIPSVKPRWEKGLYQFYTYEFDEPFVLSGTFYVGWQQQTQGSLNIGFDANNYYGYPRVFFKTENSWYPSSFQGSLLIRPIVGPDYLIQSSVDNDKLTARPGMLKIYPNPASEWFTYKYQDFDHSPDGHLAVYNLMGSKVIEANGETRQINIGFLPKGMYIVRLNSKGKVYTGKLLINH